MKPKKHITLDAENKKISKIEDNIIRYIFAK